MHSQIGESVFYIIVCSWEHFIANYTFKIFYDSISHFYNGCGSDIDGIWNILPQNTAPWCLKNQYNLGRSFFFNLFLSFSEASYKTFFPEVPSLYLEERNIFVSGSTGTQRRICTNRPCEAPPSLLAIRSYPLCPIHTYAWLSTLHQTKDKNTQVSVSLGFHF